VQRSGTNDPSSYPLNGVSHHRHYHCRQQHHRHHHHYHVLQHHYELVTKKVMGVKLMVK